ncbi:MAG: serine hydrolase [Chloroflexi bacterium]|nr:serine hydrolase [Chloroflexota bacterium]
MRWLARALCLAIVVGTLAVAGAWPVRGSTGELIAGIEGLVKNFPGGAGVWVGDPNSPVALYTRDPDEHVITASLYKLAVMLETEKRVDAKTLTYATPIVIQHEDITDDGSYEVAGTELTIDEALELMITVSDNGTALALYHLLGPENINATLQSVGLKDFHIALNQDEDNVATPRVIGQYFTMLAKKQLLSPAASDRMTARLQRQKINDRLPAQLPEGVVVAHKTGNLAGITHDAGIINTTSGPRVVVAMTWDVEEEAANQFIANVGSLVYSAILEPPASARYIVPKRPVYVDASATVPVELQITNAGARPWTATGDGSVGLIWEVRDAKNALIGAAKSPTELGVLGAAQSKRVAVPVIAPTLPGDYKVTVGLVDPRGTVLANLGAATAAFTLRSHLPFVATTQVQLPKVMHRSETSLLIVQYSKLSAAGNTVHSLALSWRAVDETTNRVVAQGTTLLGNLLPQNSTGTFFAPFAAPAIRGSYRLDFELRERGNFASETQSTKIELLAARSFPGDRDSQPAVGPFFGSGQPAPARPSGRPTATPKGKTPAPTPRR